LQLRFVAIFFLHSSGNNLYLSWNIILLSFFWNIYPLSVPVRRWPRALPSFFFVASYLLYNTFMFDFVPLYFPNFYLVMFYFVNYNVRWLYFVLPCFDCFKFWVIQYKSYSYNVRYFLQCFLYFRPSINLSSLLPTLIMLEPGSYRLLGEFLAAVLDILWECKILNRFIQLLFLISSISYLLEGSNCKIPTINILNSWLNVYLI
jgi:hypothetical protein